MEETGTIAPPAKVQEAQDVEYVAVDESTGDTAQDDKTVEANFFDGEDD
jgi:hypothetical protein